MTASIRRITKRSELINWLNSLPTEISLTAFQIILEKSKKFDFILWREDLGFKLFKKAKSYCGVEQW
jgi:hypothetical protein